MKGIKLCADCAFYSMKTHECGRGAKIEPNISKGEDVGFYVDCPLPDVESVRHAYWKVDKGDMWCSACGYEDVTEFGELDSYKYCPGCGAVMVADDRKLCD